MAFDVFVSYAHEDRDRRDKLAVHLSNLRKQGKITDWYDGDIAPGTEWKTQIFDRLDSAHIILLLISPDFMASEFCYSVELKRAMERHETDQARVIPIIVRPTDWEDAPFARLKVLPTDGKPISGSPQEDEAYLDVVRGIRQAIAHLEMHRPSAHPAEPTPKGAEEPAQIFHVPFQRNIYFTGREASLEQLHQNFSDARKGTQPQAIRGLGGVGKTQLAIEYAYRFRDEYHYIFWVKANSHDLLVADYVDIAHLLNLKLRENTDQMLTVAEVKEWLRTHESWLLILDNVEDIGIIKKTFLPSSQMGHVLLTTRTPIVGTAIQQRELTSMNLEEGMLCLLRRAKLLDPEDSLNTVNDQDRLKAAEIVEAMGGLPLALAQAGAYIEEKGCGLTGYIERYQKRRSKLLQEQGEVEHEPVATTWSLSFEEIERDHTAADLLRLCAFLHPDAIPEQLIVDGTQALSAPLQTLAEDIFELDEAVEKLKKYSLVRRNDDGKTLNIHRLVQAVLKDSMDEEAQRLWAERTAQAVSLAFPEPSTQTRQWCQQLLPHAQVCAALIQQWHMEAPEALHLLELAGKYLHEYGQYQDAENFMQQLLDIQERLYGKDHLNVARTLNTLGELARLQGHYQEAQSLYQRALSIRQQFLDPRHPDVATSLNYLARSYYHLAQYSQAAKLYEQALAIREQILGPEHPDIADSLKDLAELYEAQAKYQEALSLSQQALPIRRQALGPEHPDTARSLGMLAVLYQAQGQYQQALPLYQQVLAICEQVLGPEHPDTAVSLANLAVLYQAQGQYQQALPLFQRALAICEQVLGPEHPQTATSLSTLARLYQAQGQYQQALPLYQRDLAISEKMLGPEHPHTATSLNNLAGLYKAQGQHQQALPLYQRALAICEKVLGPEHPYTATTLNNLAGLYQAQGRMIQAITFAKKSLTIREKVLGAKHPDVANSLETLAMIYTNQNNFKNAEPAFQRALSICMQSLGPEHPHTATILINYALMLRKAKRNRKAEEMEARAEAIHVKLGQEPSQTEQED